MHYGIAQTWRACECTSLTKGLAATEEDRETLVTPLSWREPISPASLEVLDCPCVQQQQEKTESTTCQQVCSYSLAQLDITTWTFLSRTCKTHTHSEAPYPYPCTVDSTARGRVLLCTCVCTLTYKCDSLSTMW